MVTIFTEKWVFGASMCVISAYIFQAAYAIRSSLMCVFVIDRFLSVFAPYFYPRHSKKITITLSVVSVTATLLFLLPQLPGLLDCFSYVQAQGLCVFNSYCSESCRSYGLIYFNIVFIPTTLIPVVLYVLLYWKVKKIQHADASLGTQSVGGRRRDSKAAITFFLLFLSTFLLTSLFIGLMIILVHILRSSGPSPVIYILLAVSNSAPYFIPITDPIVIMRHGDVRNVLREVKLCGWGCWLKYNQVAPASSVPKSSTKVGERREQEQQQEELCEQEQQQEERREQEQHQEELCEQEQQQEERREQEQQQEERREQEQHQEERREQEQQQEERREQEQQQEERHEQEEQL